MAALHPKEDAVYSNLLDSPEASSLPNQSVAHALDMAQSLGARIRVLLVSPDRCLLYQT